jgi:flagellar motor switch protein FliG
MAQEFIKTNAEEIKLSGAQKAAILLGELGWENCEHLTSLLTDEEIKKINRAMKSLNRKQKTSGDYAKILEAELKVLSETYSFGLHRNITQPLVFSKTENDTVKNVRETAASNPQAVASFLSELLKSQQ